MKNLGIHFSIYCMLSLLLVMRARGAERLLYYCNHTSFDPDQDPGKTYKANLIDFLYWTVDASRTSFFRNSTHGDDPSSRVYGLFMCRGDVNGDACVDCIRQASKEVVNYCVGQMVAYTWYDLCFLRYSNQPYRPTFSGENANFQISAWNTQLVDPQLQDKFNQVLGETMQKIADRAANDTRPDKKYAVEEAQISWHQKLYTLAQCTPDLLRLECQRCLKSAIASLPENSVGGGRSAYPICNIRYEIYPFYNISTLPSTSEGPPIDPVQPPPIDPVQSRISGRTIIAIVLSIASFIVLFIISFVFLKRRSTKRHEAKMLAAAVGDDISIDPESLQYSLSEIELATNKFSADNKIGQGGFGGVYKGKLPNGQDIAVKRLSKSSGQGAAEFKNEIGVVAKLQHRNLVRLLGFCLEGEEKILVYEFVPNRSLEDFLFDPHKQGLLNWSTRRNIIVGIARGLLYLHEDSRLKIVHRDLKAGNVLLDESMHPKIADFGMAKICKIDESEGNTTRIAGTFGYMAPEYTRSGQYSVKSDVFSFGVVVLEIITGKKNSTFYQSGDSEDLLSYAWRHWRDGRPLALLDPTIEDSYIKNEVIQSLHVGLLCVEEDADKRPTMASVVYMLNSTSVTLPTPVHPASRRNISEIMLQDLESDRSYNKLLPESVNVASITEACPR